MRVVSIILVLAATLLDANSQQASVLAEGAKLQKLAGEMSFTEGPVWIPGQNKLIFSDIHNFKLMQWHSEDGLSVFREDSEAANGNLLDLQGYLLSCRHTTRDLVRYNENGAVEVIADRFAGGRFHSPNDLAISSDGSVWFTDPPWGLKDRHREVGGNWVYCRKPNGTVTVVSKDLAMPNGIVFSPDESIMYISDTGGFSLVEDPSLRNAPALVHIYRVNPDHTLTKTGRTLDANSDGMCVDVLGNVYTTTKDGVKVFDQNGQFVTLISTPEHAANACFGGDAYQTLFITARTSLYSIRLSNRGAKPTKAIW